MASLEQCITIVSGLAYLVRGGQEIVWHFRNEVVQPVGGVFKEQELVPSVFVCNLEAH